MVATSAARRLTTDSATCTGWRAVRETKASTRMPIHAAPNRISIGESAA
jgi:hypothetical protein